ncbi:MAG: protein translocase subunit SecF [Marmoricola sp.]
MGKFSRLGNALYEGRTSVDFVGRKWLWYAISGVILIASISGLLFRGLNLGIEFKGGVEYSVTLPASQVTQANADHLVNLVSDSGLPGSEAATAVTVKTSLAGTKPSIKVQTEEMSNADRTKVSDLIAQDMKVANPASDISVEAIGASWGKQVANRAIEGLIVFLFLVTLFIWGYFREWKMSVAALVALVHDVSITVGVYALSGFEVTPATVTGVLTILGFSLYDTVVVFDKVRENTKDLRSSRRTYAELANLAVNQTLVRSVNTSIVALLPVGALLYVGQFVLGSGTLKDLALALFVGMAVGAYSSIFIATPLLAQLKSREAAVSEQDRRAKARQRRDADRYANVPSFTEDMPVAEEPAELDEDAPARVTIVAPAPPRRPEATGSGRVVPEKKAPVEQSGAAHRPQPNRQSRSKRGK